jgi:hypothetical protein
MKLPAFQFYPADWKKDPGVQCLSFHDRGVWFEILCLMHESEQRGKLMLNGQAMPESALARLLGLDKQNLTNTITTLVTYGVASRCEDTGALVNRRMLRDEKLRQIRTEAGKKGGNPALLNQNPNQNDGGEVKQNPTPSSSSSSSSLEREREGAGAGETLSAGTRRPTLSEALSAASTMGISPEKADEWWHAREASGWLKGMAGGGTSPVGTNFQADLKTYASRGGFQGGQGNDAKPNKKLTKHEWE